MPRVSVIIPTYGRPTLLLDAIASVLAQQVAGIEIIVVDDASPEPITVTGDHLRHSISENRGSAAARNLGVSAATGDILAFLDDDDQWTRAI